MYILSVRFVALVMFDVALHCQLLMCCTDTGHHGRTDMLNAIVQGCQWCLAV